MSRDLKEVSEQTMTKSIRENSTKTLRCERGIPEKKKGGGWEERSDQEEGWCVS